MPNLPYPYLDQSEYPSVSSALLTALQGNLDALALQQSTLTARSWPSTVTTLPTSPTNGQEVYYVADSTNGVVWHLKYRSASVSSYKWEFVGGGRLRGLNTTTDNPVTAGAFTYTDLANSPTVTVPLAGDYDVTFGSQLTLRAAALIQADIALFTSANVSLGLPAVTHIGTQNFESDSVSETWAATSVAAGTALKLRVQTNPAGAVISVANKFLVIQPVRVG